MGGHPYRRDDCHGVTGLNSGGFTSVRAMFYDANISVCAPRGVNCCGGAAVRHACTSVLGWVLRLAWLAPVWIFPHVLAPSHVDVPSEHRGDSSASWKWDRTPSQLDGCLQMRVPESISRRVKLSSASAEVKPRGRCPSAHQEGEH